MWPTLSLSGLRDWRDRRRALRDMRGMQQLDESMLALDMNNPVYRARIALEAGDADGALEFWVQARERYPEYVLKSHDSIEILLRLKRFEEANTLMLEGKRRFPREPYYLEGYAQIPELTGDVAEALRRWAIVRKKFPLRPMGYVNGATCLTKLKRPEQAAKLLRRAVGVFTSSVTIMMAYAKNAEDLGQWEEALVRWRVVTDKFRHFTGVVGAARALQQLGCLDEAETTLTEGRLKYSLEIEVVIELARLAQKRGKEAEAVRWWQFAYQRFPLNPRGYSEAARFMESVHRLADADEILVTAIDRFPDEHWPLVEYALLAHERQDWPEAAKRWEALRSAFPDRGDGYLRGAQALIACGREEEAAQVRARQANRPA